MPEKQLDEQLDFVVETAVNKVRVNVNTASASSLEHIAGLTKTTAANVVAFRDENGKFTNRTQLKKVPRLGPKAYEQAVGFYESLMERIHLTALTFTQSLMMLLKPF